MYSFSTGYVVAQTAFSVESLGPMIYAQAGPVYLEEFWPALVNVFILYGSWFALVSLLTFRYRFMENVSRWKIVLAAIMPSLIIAIAEAMFIRSGGYGSGWLGSLNYYPNGFIYNLLMVLIPVAILSGLIIAVLVRFQSWRLAGRMIREMLLWSTLAQLVFSAMFYITSA